MYGAYIFLSNDGTAESRKAFDILDFFSEFGGMMEIMLFIWVFLAESENEDNMLKMLVASLYFTPKDENSSDFT